MKKFKVLLETIIKRGNKFVVMNKAKTRVLGTHPTRGKAVDQLQAIEASKARRGNK